MFDLQNKRPSLNRNMFGVTIQCTCGKFCPHCGVLEKYF